MQNNFGININKIFYRSVKKHNFSKLSMYAKYLKIIHKKTAL